MEEKKITRATGFTPPWYFKSVTDVLYSDNFPWFYKDKIVTNPSMQCEELKFAKNQSGFAHIMFRNGKPESQYFQLIVPFINAVQEQFDEEINELIRVRVQMTTNRGEAGCLNPHIDFDYPHKTVLWYLNDSDGDTIFFNEYLGDKFDKLTYQDRNKPTANQAVLFNGLQYHCTSLPQESSFRIVLNLNYI